MGVITRQSLYPVWHSDLNLPIDCDICVKKLLMTHALSCPKVGLVLARHNDASQEWGALLAQAINPSDISYEPKINSRTVLGERNGVGDRVETGDQEGEEQDDKEVETVQATVYDESWADISPNTKTMLNILKMVCFHRIILSKELCEQIDVLNFPPKNH